MNTQLFPKRNILDVMARMYVDYVFELAASPQPLSQGIGATAGPKDGDVDDGAYADDDKDERTSPRPKLATLS